MNKALLLIICDFLLISVLALVEFDVPEDPPEPIESRPEVEAGINADMLELLQLSLEEENARRAQLAAEKERIEAAKTAVEEERAALQQNLSLTQEEKETLEAERARIAAEAAQLARDKAALAEAQRATEADLARTREEQAAIARDLDAEARRVALLQAELKQQQDALADTRQTLAQKEAEATALAQERQQLSTRLQITETERGILQENLAAARSEVEIARVERRRAEERTEQLTEAVSQVAEQSEGIKEEFRRAQPISLNEIFRRYETNRLPLRFEATFPGFLSERTERYALDAILVSSGGRTYALFEGSLGPFALENLGRLRAVKGSFDLAGRTLEMVEISFLQADPRVVAVEIPERFVKASGLAPFTLAEDPFRFPQAVLVSNQLGDYGETDFRLIPGGERYIGVSRSLLGKLAGTFQPSRGDYVFAKTGNLMGMMVEGDRGVLLPTVSSEQHLSLGRSFDSGAATRLQSRLQRQLPSPPTGR